MSPDDSSQINTIQLRTRFQLLRLISALGLAMALIFSIQHLNAGVYWLGTSLLLVSAVGTTNLLLFKNPDDYYKAVTALAITAYLLSALLIFSGGVDGTGLYWAYPLLSITIFTTRFRTGLILFCLFVFIATMSWWLDAPWVQYDYPENVQVRFLISITLLGLLCLSREYTVDQSMVHMDNLRLNLSVAANTDSLTGLFNRRFIHENYIAQGQFVPGIQENSAILLCDIDHFKQVNDHYGHDVGDNVLKMVADNLKLATRSDDIVARWGGEEFLVILPEVSAEVAKKRAQQFVRDIASETLYLDAGELKLTISVGLSHIGSGKSAEAILKDADQKLYQAKAEGRNRVCF